MELPAQVKQALRDLPPAERVVAYALKKIYESIRLLNQKQEKQVNQSRSGFTSKYQAIEYNAAAIINGKKLTKDDLPTNEEFFVEEDKHEIGKILNSEAPIKDYWLVTLKNSRLTGLITPKDEDLLAHLTKLDQKVTQTTLDIVLTFKGSPEVKDGSYTRSLRLQNGRPISFKGDIIKTKSPLEGGLIHQLSEQIETESIEALTLKFDMISFLVTELIPYSLRFFLGEIDEDEGDEDEQDEDQGSQQEPQPTKK